MPTNPAINNDYPTQVNNLLHDIDENITIAENGGRSNHITDLCCSIGAIIASYVGALFTAINFRPTWIAAGIISLAGLLASIQKKIDQFSFGEIDINVCFYPDNNGNNIDIYPV